MTLRFLQLAIFCAVLFGAIWFEQANDYPINSYIKGVWAFLAAYGFTLLWARVEDWRVRSRGGFGGPASEE